MMKNLTRRKLVLAVASGLGTLASSRLPAQTAGGKAVVASAGQPARNTATTVRAASASVRLTDDNMQELHAKQKVFSQGWEGEIRASALVLAAEQRVCVVSLDAQNMRSYVSRPAAKRIAAVTGIPEDNILICATHTHRGPP